MPTLHDQLGEAVDDVTTDLDTLAAVARRRGTTQRRVRQGLSTLASAAAVAAIAAGGWVLVQSDDGATGTDLASSAGPSSPADADGSGSAPAEPQGTPVPMNGRLAAAVLLQQVEEETAVSVEPGSLGGQGGVDLLDPDGTVVITAQENPDSYATATVTSDRGTSEVGVNVQHWAAMDLKDDCSRYRPSDHCQVQQLPGGDVLRTTEHTDEKPGSLYRSTELISPSRDLRISIGLTTDEGETPALTDAQLVSIASDPLWGHEVPDDLLQQAADLRDYTWLVDAIVGTEAGEQYTPTPAE